MKLKKMLAMLSALCMCAAYLPLTQQAVQISANAEDSGTCGENLTWTLDDEGILTISGTGEMDDFPLIYSSDLNDTPWVDKLADIKSVIIEEGVTSIGNGAFSHFENLTSVSIPDSVTSIGNNAFLVCRKLKTVTLPDTLTDLGEGAFWMCSNLRSINIPDTITNIEYGVFLQCSALTSIDIPDSVTTIGTAAFTKCSGLTSLDIPTSVTTIGDSAFSGCSGLTSLVIPDSVTAIGPLAFSGCSGLTSIDIPDSITTIEWGTFAQCTALPSLTLPDSITTIEYCAFQKCENLISIDIPDSVTKIGNASFHMCYALESITIPEHAVIEPGAFEWCYSLETVNIPESVTDIGFFAFADTPWLEAQQEENPLVIVNDVLIDAQTAQGDVVIPDGVMKITEGAFWNAVGLTSITVPESVATLEPVALYNKSGVLDSITIKNPDCDIQIDEERYSGGPFPETTVIYGYANSTAQAYAEEYNLTFVALDNSKSLPAAAEELQQGDANGDGTVDILDVILVNQAIMGKASMTEEQVKAIDFNGNNKPDAEESLTLLKYIVNLIDTFE